MRMAEQKASSTIKEPRCERGVLICVWSLWGCVGFGRLCVSNFCLEGVSKVVLSQSVVSEFNVVSVQKQQFLAQ